MTFNQLLKTQKRVQKKVKSKSPRLERSPHRKGICVRVFTMKPKKPNSAIRKVAKLKIVKHIKIKKLRTFVYKYITAYIPGQGHNLQKFSVALIRGGRVPDLPGIHYHLIRGKHDFVYKETISRKKKRSKYSIPKAF
jgi:small subunit ribosomal protein S12